MTAQSALIASRQIARVGSGCPGEPAYWIEWLCISPSGQVFVHGVGGSDSRYCQPSGDNWIGGEATKPLSISETKEWLGRYRGKLHFVKEQG